MTWTPVGGPNGEVRALLTLPNGDVVVGGAFPQAGTAVQCIARWDGANWSALGSGMTNATWPVLEVTALARMPNGDLIAGGLFSHAGGAAASAIARWDGANWHALGTGLTTTPGFEPMVRALAVLPNGDLIAGGYFTHAGGQPANNIARWNGTTWSPLAAGLVGGVLALQVLATGDVVAGGYFVLPPQEALARWDGSSWSPFATGLTLQNGWTEPGVHALTLLANGDLLAGGEFDRAGGAPASGVARWNGSSWSGLGMGPGNTHSLAITPSGNVVAGGSYWFGGWHGAATWNGVHWAPIPTSANSHVWAMTHLTNGDLCVGGVDNGWPVPSAHFGRLTTTCPAAATAVASGCSGSATHPSFIATSLPWSGAVLQTTGTGLPSPGLTLRVTGFAPAALPLVSLLPQGAPGCLLLTTPDLLDLLAPVGGTTQTQLLIPATPSLAGQTFRQQLLVITLGPGGHLAMLASSNALLLTIGSF